MAPLRSALLLASLSTLCTVRKTKRSRKSELSVVRNPRQEPSCWGRSLVSIKVVTWNSLLHPCLSDTLTSLKI